MGQSKTPKQERIHGLDAYRAVLMMLGVVLHGAEPFLNFMVDTLPHHAHYRGQFNTSDFSEGLISYIVAFVRVFRMPAFFLLAGYFMALLWEQRGAKATLKNRFERIYAPFFVVILISGFFAPAFPPQLWHLWFLYTLMGLIPLVAFLAWLSKRLGIQLHSIGVWLKNCFENTIGCVLLVSAINFFLLTALELHEAPVLFSWFPAPATFTYYFVFILMGWILYATKVDLTRTSKHAGKMVLMGAIFTPIYAVQLLLAYDGQLDDLTVLRIFHSLALICLTRGLIGLFLRWVPTFSRGWRYASDASYWVYLVHLPVAYHLPRLWMGSETPALLLFLANVVLTLVICFTTYDLFVRSTFIGRFLNGRRYERGSLVWSLGGAGATALCLVLSAQFASTQATAKQAKWEAWENAGGRASLVPFLEALDPLLPRVSTGTEDGENLCLPTHGLTVCKQTSTWQEANQHCQHLGASVVTPKSRIDQETIHSIWMENHLHGPHWIALTDQETEGTWIWPDGTPPTETFWTQREPGLNPNRNCAVNMPRVDIGQWTVRRCEKSETWIVCKYSHTQSAAQELEAASNAPDGFGGVWALTPDSLQESEQFKAAPESEHHLAMAMVNLMDFRLTFSGEHIEIVMPIEGKREHLKLPYSIDSRTPTSLHLNFGERTNMTMHIERIENVLHLDDGSRKIQLALQRQ